MLVGVQSLRQSCLHKRLTGEGIEWMQVNKREGCSVCITHYKGSPENKKVQHVCVSRGPLFHRHVYAQSFSSRLQMNMFQNMKVLAWIVRNNQCITRSQCSVAFSDHRVVLKTLEFLFKTCHYVTRQSWGTSPIFVFPSQLSLRLGSGFKMRVLCIHCNATHSCIHRTNHNAEVTLSTITARLGDMSLRLMERRDDATIQKE